MRNFQSGVALRKKWIYKVLWDNVYKLDAAGVSSASNTGAHNNMSPGGRGCQKAFLAFCTLRIDMEGTASQLEMGPYEKLSPGRNLYFRVDDGFFDCRYASAVIV